MKETNKTQIKQNLLAHQNKAQSTQTVSNKIQQQQHQVRIKQSLFPTNVSTNYQQSFLNNQQPTIMNYGPGPSRYPTVPPPHQFSQPQVLYNSFSEIEKHYKYKMMVEYERQKKWKELQRHHQQKRHQQEQENNRPQFSQYNETTRKCKLKY